MKKIILYTPRLMPGGVLVSNKLLSEGFAKKGYDVLIVANKKTKYKIENFPHYYLNAGDITRPFKLRNIILKERPSAIFANMLPQNISLSISKKLLSSDINVKCFGFVRNSSSYKTFNQFYHLPYRLLVKKLYKNLDKIIAVSNITKKDTIKTFFLDEKDVEVIFDPIDLEYINRLKDEPLNEKEKRIFKRKTILYVGRFAIQKRLDLLLDIFYEIIKIDKNINLILIGEGEEKEKLIKKTKELNIDKHTYFLPFTENPFKYMKNAKLFVLTSQDEGFGRVVAESLACGTPVIAYENEYSGHKDIIIHGKNGFLIPFNNKDLMIRHILKILNDDDIHFKLKNSSEQSVQEFSVENVINKLDALF
ncbi:glycosyltransferase [Persephonella sp.]